MDARVTRVPDAAPDGEPPDAGGASPPVPDASPANDWPSYGRDLANTRDNPVEARIDRSTVASLRPHWTWRTAAVTSTPAYFQGVLYFGDWRGYAVALDARTGRELWRVLLPGQTIAQVTGSASVDAESVYIGSDVSLYKLARASGAVQWSTAVGSAESSAHVYSSPAVAGDSVLTGVGSFQNVNPIADGLALPPFRGSMVAVDRETGAERWRFSLTTGKGVGVAASAAVDLALGRLFIGTGQNYDDSDSPYADSLLALDLSTGAYVWHRQFTPADQYSLTHLHGPDHDVLATPNLLADGAVVVGDKGGSFFAFERDGTPRWAKEITPGGHHGGVMGSAAASGDAIFVCSGDFSTDHTLGLGQDGPARSMLLALAAKDGSTLWSVPIEGACYGAVSHARGVVYLPTVAGAVHAYAADDGELLWSDPLPGSSAGGITIADGMLFVPFGWDWIDTSAPGGVVAYALP
jgi:polyvinyl alcohol dehydrogenase (cytochrome)